MFRSESTSIVCTFIHSYSSPSPLSVYPSLGPTSFLSIQIATRLINPYLIQLRVATRRFGWKRQVFKGKLRRCSLAHGYPTPSLRPLPSYFYLCVWACVSLRRMPVNICSDLSTFVSCLGPVLAVCRVSCLLRIVSRIAYP